MAAKAPRGVRVQEPDPRVIRAAAQHDQAAFGEIVRAYQAHVWRFLRHLLNDDALAEDLTQETFIRIYRKLHTFQFRSKFSTWVLNVARNAGTDELRSRRRRARLVDALATPPPTPRDPLLRIEVEEAVATLTPTLRETLCSSSCSDSPIARRPRRSASPKARPNGACSTPGSNSPASSPRK